MLGHQCPFAHGPCELRNPIPFGLYTQCSSNTLIPEKVSELQQRLYHSAPSDPEIDQFKTDLCAETCCKLKPCTRFHNAYDRRRDPRLFAYASLPCKAVYDPARRKFGNPNSCPKADACRY